MCGDSNGRDGGEGDGFLRRVTGKHVHVAVDSRAKVTHSGIVMVVIAIER